jgi:putative pyruvate formate lyase activating enzyme
MNEIFFHNGQCIVYDPGPEMIAFLSAVSPGFKVESIQPGPGFTPRFQKLTKEEVVLERPLFELNPEELREAFFRKGQHPDKPDDGHKYSRLQVLQALAFSELSHCRLCGWGCGVNRFLGERGKCGLGSQFFASDPFIHVAEESVINPALVTNLAGCSLRCVYCIASKTWKPENFNLLDTKAYWEKTKDLMKRQIHINTTEFTNPTESLPGVIGVLPSAPEDLKKPVVMNCHLYSSERFYELAAPATDIWMPDLRYGNNACSKSLSGVDRYMEYAKLGLEEMVKSGAKILVRILVLPGHVSCCHEPSLRLLSEYKDKVWVSVLDQYVPEHEAHLDPNLKRRPTRSEIADVENMVKKFGLRNVSVNSRDFWR